MATRDAKLRKLLEEGHKFCSDLMVLSRQKPETIAWKEPQSRIYAVVCARSRLAPIPQRPL